jgi:23S rRNA pseudouridine1911/1915/1917 synthase
VTREQVRTIRANPPERMRLDAYLARELAPEVSRSQIARAIRAGLVLMNERTARAADPVCAGDRIQLRVPEPQLPVPGAAPAPDFEVLWEDADLIFVNKPPGMAVHPSPGHPHSTLVDALVARFPDLAAVMELDGTWRAGIVHRLDKDTSGVIVVARNAVARAALSDQFKQRTVEKVYIAVAAGHPTQDRLTIDRPIGRHQIDRKRMSVRSGDGRDALSEVTIIGRGYLTAGGQAIPIAVAAVHPRTGRTHQIRVHLASIGHPCLGDPLYGRQDRQRLAIKRQALHAYYLEVSHPRGGGRVAVTAPVAPDLEPILAAGGVEPGAIAAKVLKGEAEAVRVLKNQD